MDRYKETKIKHLKNKIINNIKIIKKNEIRKELDIVHNNLTSDILHIFELIKEYYEYVCLWEKIAGQKERENIELKKQILNHNEIMIKKIKEFLEEGSINTN